MSEFHVVVVEIKGFGKHPNADNLSITNVLGGYPVIFKTGQFQVGDKAVYIPVDAICPTTDPRFAFLGENNRIKARRLRGIFSMGLLVEANPEWEVGQNVQNELGITKWEPVDPITLGGENERDPGFLPVYTDIEGLRKYSHVLTDGEEVVLTEKIHGANSRFVWRDDRLWVGSHKCIKKPSDINMWWKLANRIKLAEKLSKFPGVAIYGEAYGQVQDLRYGCGQGEVNLVLFDAMDTKSFKYLDYDDLLALAKELELPTVPEVYRGPWHDTPETRALAEGKSILYPGNIREGFVVRPIKERFDSYIGRVVLKLVGEGYLTRKGA